MTKTAISIPNDVYASAEQLAKRLGTSRSGLYTRALSDYIARHQKTGVTTKLNEVYAECDSSLDPQLAELQHSSLPREEW